MSKVKILTLNIKCLAKNYRHAILLIKTQPDFLLLQETNIDSERKVQDMKIKMGVPEGYFSLGQIGSGVALFNCTGESKIINTNRANQGEELSLRYKI